MIRQLYLKQTKVAAPVILHILGIAGLFFVCVSFIIFVNITLAATTESVVPVPEKKQENNSAKPSFEYMLENRPDPFIPFITEKAAASNINMDEIVDSQEPLTGMQLFEPGQLTLVALMKNGNQDIAMVEDFTGKGYVLTEGQKIGRRGIIKDIAPNTVLIEETASTRAGKKIVTEIVMILKKEGEE